MTHKLAAKSLTMKKSKYCNRNLAKASLLMHACLVTGDHKRLLRKAYLSIYLRKRLESLNLWNHGDIDKIWWKVYEMSIKDKRCRQQQLIQKFATKHIACNYQQNKYYNYKNATCCACNSEVETQY
jgi:hypothetical protein